MGSLVPDLVDGDDGYVDMPEHVRGAFLIYVSTGTRSHVKTAKLSGHPIGTVKSWAHRYQWPARMRDIDREAANSAISAGLAVAAAQTLNNLSAAISIRDDPSAPHFARMRAIEWISGIVGLSPRMASPSSVLITMQGDDDTGTHLTQSELDALAASGDVATLLALSRGQRPPS